MNINLNHVEKSVAQILSRAMEGHEISAEEGEVLLHAGDDDLKAVMQTANFFRTKKHGKDTTFVVTRNINFTNVCHMDCHFCGFGKRKESSEAELLPMEEIARRTLEAAERGATEVCIQGGLHPDLPGDYYRKIVQTVREAVPDIHLHAFSPFEIYYGSRKSRRSYQDFFTDLKESGLNSIPGTAAEILDTEVRQILTTNKLSADAWVDIIRAAHKVGLRSTATMMYGHVDEPRHWANHIDLLRNIQKDTGGFTEFVPLGFVHYESPLYLNNRSVRPGPTRRENIAVHAVARIMLNNHIDNIQASWVKMGPQFAQEALSYGVNDLGGTLMNESISRSSGALYGQEITATEMVSIIGDAGFKPIQRNTFYGHLEMSQNALSQKPLVERVLLQSHQGQVDQTLASQIQIRQVS